MSLRPGNKSNNGSISIHPCEEYCTTQRREPAVSIHRKQGLWCHVQFCWLQQLDSRETARSLFQCRINGNQVDISQLQMKDNLMGMYLRINDMLLIGF